MYVCVQVRICILYIIPTQMTRLSTREFACASILREFLCARLFFRKCSLRMHTVYVRATCLGELITTKVCLRFLARDLCEPMQTCRHMCMFVNLYTYTYICICTYMYIHIHICIRVFLFGQLTVHMKSQRVVSHTRVSPDANQHPISGKKSKHRPDFLW